MNMQTDTCPQCGKVNRAWWVHTSAAAGTSMQMYLVTAGAPVPPPLVTRWSNATAPATTNILNSGDVCMCGVTWLY
jgi:xanthine/uracil permease